VSRRPRHSSFREALRAEWKEAGPYLVLMVLGVGLLLYLVLWMATE